MQVATFWSLVGRVTLTRPGMRRVGTRTYEAHCGIILRPLQVHIKE